MVIGSLKNRQSTSVFEEDSSMPTRKPLSELSTKGLRNPLSSLLTNLETSDEQENVSSKELSCYPISYNRSQISLTNDIFSADREHRVGIAVSYKKLLTCTVNRILTASANEILSASNPKKIRIADGLDGSGYHRVYQQATHPNISTSFILFGFKVTSISDKPSSKYPISIRSVAILALQVNEDNIRYLMDTLINNEFTEITEN